MQEFTISDKMVIDTEEGVTIPHVTITASSIYNVLISTTDQVTSHLRIISI